MRQVPLSRSRLKCYFLLHASCRSLVNKSEAWNGQATCPRLPRCGTGGSGLVWISRRRHLSLHCDHHRHYDYCEWTLENDKLLRNCLMSKTLNFHQIFFHWVWQGCEPRKVVLASLWNKFFRSILSLDWNLSTQIDIILKTILLRITILFTQWHHKVATVYIVQCKYR